MGEELHESASGISWDREVSTLSPQKRRCELINYRAFAAVATHHSGQRMHFFYEASSHVTHVQWMGLGMSGLPGAFAHLRAVEVIVTELAPARCLRMEESLAAAQPDRLSSATSLSAQVSQATSDHSCRSSMHTEMRSIHKNISFLITASACRFCWHL